MVSPSSILPSNLSSNTNTNLLLNDCYIFCKCPQLGHSPSGRLQCHRCPPSIPPGRCQRHLCPPPSPPGHRQRRPVYHPPCRPPHNIRSLFRFVGRQTPQVDPCFASHCSLSRIHITRHHFLSGAERRKRKLRKRSAGRAATVDGEGGSTRRGYGYGRPSKKPHDLQMQMPQPTTEDVRRWRRNGHGS